MCVCAVGGCFDPQKGCTKNEHDNSAINTQTQTVIHTHTNTQRTMSSVCLKSQTEPPSRHRQPLTCKQHMYMK